MRTATYCRVSTGTQETDGTSLDSQLEACLAYCRSKDYNIAYQFKETYSGDALERPELDKLRELVRSEQVDAVVIYCLDRLSRDPTHGVILTQELEKHSVTLEAVTEDIDNSELGKLISYIRGYAAKIELAKIKERTKRGLLARVKRGQLPSGQRGQLFGYTYLDGKRYINEAEAETVRDMFKWAIEGQPLNAITYRLRAMDITTPSGKGYWARSSVHAMLTNRSYTGVTTEFGVELHDVTPLIIPQDTFDKVQARLELNRGKSGRTSTTEYLLRGLMICARCGRKYWGYAHTATRERRYYCMGRKAIVTPHKCDNIGYKADHLEGLVWREVEQVLAHPDLVLVGLKAQREELQKVATTEKEIDTVRCQLLNREGQRKQIHKAFYLCKSSVKNDELFKQDITELDAEVKVLDERLNHLLGILNAREQIDVGIEGINKAVAVVKGNLSNLNFQNKRLAVEALEIKVYIDGDHISIQGAVPMTKDILSTPSSSSRQYATYPFYIPVRAVIASKLANMPQSPGINQYTKEVNANLQRPQVTQSEAAEMLNVSPRTVATIKARGDGVACNVPSLATVQANSTPLKPVTHDIGQGVL